MNQIPHFSTKTTAIVITTAMLTFVSYWRAASVVLCDLGSSAFYACGIAEQAIGKAAPWFILGIMCLSLCVRAVYMESCAMFVRGGVYKVVKNALGGPLAKISVSALIFDYSLTGPISAVSAGHYLAGFLNHFLPLAGLHAFYISPPLFAMAFACIVIIYFWRKNVIGIAESSGKTLKIVQLSSIMIVALLLWCIVTLILQPVGLPPFRPEATEESLGWLHNFSWAKTIGLVGVFIALGHSILAMSGEESLAQLYRELASPKIKNLKRAAIIIFAFSFIFTGIISLFAVMIIPDAIRPNYYDNLIAGLAMHLAGPTFIKLVMQGFVVLVGVLLLSGAVNTSLVGANGALNRLAEDGVITSWFRRPHTTYGTTHRFLTALAIMQLAVTLICQGNIYLLGEAYAFGVVWCFVSQTLAVLVLRWKDRSPREFTVPLNIKIGDVQFPIGITLVFIILFGIAVTNFFTKTTATKAGVLFTIVVYILLRFFEYFNKRRRPGAEHALEVVNLKFHDSASPDICGCKHEHRILVTARNPKNLEHLRAILKDVKPATTDVLVMTVKQGHVVSEGTVEDLPNEERELLTNIVATAEKYGVHVIPLLIPSTDPMFALARAAYDLGVQEIVMGQSKKMGPEIQLENLAMAWGYVSAGSNRKVMARIIWPGHELKYELS